MSKRKQNQTRVGIVGSLGWQNRRKIKDSIWKMKGRFGSELQIVSTGNKDGADKMAKKFCLELECNYKEFNPAYTNANLYSACHENYYGKEYSPRYIFHRNDMFCKHIDYLMVFIDKGDSNKGIIDIINKTKKLNKPVVIVY